MERIITDTMFQDFRNYLKENERSEATIHKYIHDIDCFSVYADRKEINKEMVLAYKSELSHKYAISSANSMIASLNTFFKFMEWNDLCIRQFKVQKKVYCNEEKEISKSDYMKLLSVATEKKKERLNLLIQTICGTGIRVSELSAITVEAVRNGEAIISCKGKTRKVFIVSKLRKKLLKYAMKARIHSGAIFITRTGKPMDRSNIWREMKKLCKEANISEEKVFPHNLRHLFARTFYNMDKDIAKLSDILGHTSINTTRVYIISTGAEHRRQMENMRLII